MQQRLPPPYPSTGLASSSNSHLEVAFAGKNGITSKGVNREVCTV